MLLIYCNSCFDTKEETDRGFVITNCYHVFCNGCLEYILKDFCILCKDKCKMLPINNELPQEVKEYFDYGSIGRYIEKIEKISLFIENQNKMYIDKNAGCRETYHQYKKSILEMTEQAKELDKAILREEGYMKRLKVAIETDNITTDLLELPSPVFSNISSKPKFVNEHQARSSLSEVFNQRSSSSKRLHSTVVKEVSNKHKSKDEQTEVGNKGRTGSSESNGRINKQLAISDLAESESSKRTLPKSSSTNEAQAETSKSPAISNINKPYNKAESSSKRMLLTSESRASKQSSFTNQLRSPDASNKSVNQSVTQSESNKRALLTYNNPKSPVIRQPIINKGQANHLAPSSIIKPSSSLPTGKRPLSSPDGKRPPNSLKMDRMLNSSIKYKQVPAQDS